MPRWPASASSPTIWSTSGSLSRRADNRAMGRPSASPRNRPGRPLVIIYGQFVMIDPRSKLPYPGLLSVTCARAQRVHAEHRLGRQLPTAVMSGTIRPTQCQPLDRRPLGRANARGVRSQYVRRDQSSDRSSPHSLTCDVPLHHELLPAGGDPTQPKPSANPCAHWTSSIVQPTRARILSHEWRQPALRQIKNIACVPRWPVGPRP
jgi:hypothetical protein